MTDVVLAACSGGIVNLTLIEDLRGDTVTGDARELADLALFEDRAGVRPTRAQYEADFEAAFATGRSLWSAHADELEQGMEASRLRDRLIGPFLSLLGYDLQYQRSHLAAGDETFRITHLGWAADDAPPMILDPSPLDERGERQRRSAHDEMQAYLNASSQHTWGIVSNGRVLRLVRDFHHTRTKGFAEFELEHIFEAGSVEDFRAFVRVCHSSRFTARPHLHGGEVGGEQGPYDASLLELLHHRSVSAGVAAGRRLQPQVRRAIEHLANGALSTNPDLRRRVLEEAGFGRELYRELLTVLYRVLFLLFAEQREMLHGNRLYQETYSMARLRKTAESRRTEGRRFDLWEGLKATFAAFHDDSKATALGVYPYNGELFDPSRTPNLGSAHIPNSELAIAIRSLTTVEVNKMTLYVDYRNLGVEELGTVYESLLDYRLRINDTGHSLAVKDPTSERNVPSGHAYLAPMSTERGDLASYYTPPALVSLVLDRSLEPLLEERLTAAGPDPLARAAAILDLRIIDPACGSGAFLAEALERLAIALAGERSKPSEPSDAEAASARREILSRCIYGADKDPFAVELCKVALWIHCAVPDAPLSFLDHHIICGDSLVGWPMFEVPDSIPDGAFDFSKATVEDKKILKAARLENKEYVAGVQTLWAKHVEPAEGLSLPSLLQEPDRTHGDVREKAQAFAEYLASRHYQERKSAADLWTSAFFWSHRHGPAPTTRQYRSALSGELDAGLSDEATTLCNPLNPLHWALAFPDIRDREGFDLVIGNPPWEVFENEELEFFAESAPSIAALTSQPRKEAIELLAESDPEFYARWKDYQTASNRLAHFAKTSDRFTRTAGKVNTYPLFTELAANLTAAHGRVGLVVQSGIAIDLGQSVLWESLVNQGRVIEVRDIVNGGPTGSTLIFPSVDAKERYSLLVLGPYRPATEFGASMMNMSLEEAEVKELTPWSAERLRTVCPATGTLLSAQHQWEIDLTTQLHARLPTLAFDRTTSPNGENPWGLGYAQLFNSSTAQPLFSRREVLESEGWEIQPDRSFHHPDGRRLLPVFEGQMINRWDHRAKTFEGYSGPNKYGRAPGIPESTSAQHGDSAFEVEPRYWMLEATANDRIQATVGDRAMVAYRDVTSTWRNSRSVKACLLFPTPATHNLPILTVSKHYVLAFVALINSTIFDFLARVHVPGAHLSPWVISQCAAPPPSSIDCECAALAGVLSSTSGKLANAYDLELYPWDEESRPSIEAECDARIARSYGLVREEYEQLFGHFVVMSRVEIAKFGEYRTKRLCLEAYDRLGGGS